VRLAYIDTGFVLNILLETDKSDLAEQLLEATRRTFCDPRDCNQRDTLCHSMSITGGRICLKVDLA